MLYYGASVNEKSNEAKFVMRDVPTKSFSGVDVRMFFFLIKMFDIKTTFYSFHFVIYKYYYITFVLLQYRRLLDVIHSNSVALSGSKFFYVTKGMILTVSLKAHNRKALAKVFF